MTAYIIRRLLLMIPTFFGILVINFAVLRMQGPTLVEQMGATPGAKSEGVGGERKVQAASKNYENYIDRFRLAGNDLPAVVNLRGFWSKDDVVRQLRQASPASGLKDSDRNRIEKELWLSGPFAVEPLYQVLKDDALSDLHGPASMAFTLCAYASVEPRDLPRLTPEERAAYIANATRIQDRNQVLRLNRIDYEAVRGQGFALRDNDYAAKRAALLRFFEDPANHAQYVFSAGGRWSAILFQTGFCDFMGKLFTGTLWSDSRKTWVFTLIGERWQVSFWLNTLSIVIAWAVSIPLGIRSARRLGTLEDRVTTNALFLLWSLPAMFVGTLLLHHFCTAESGGHAWFPNRGLSSDDSLWYTTPVYLLDLLWHAALPLLVLTYSSFTALSRYMRGNLLDQLNADYTRTARAKGCSDDAVVYGHALRNSMLTMITLGAGLLAELFGGSVVVETIFSVPGLGYLLVDAARQTDGPLVMGSTVISVGLLLVGILIADILYAVVDPRLRGAMPEPGPAHRSPLQQAWSRLLGKTPARIGLAVVGAMTLLAIYAPFIANEAALVWSDERGVRLPAVADLFNRWTYAKPHDLLFNLLALALPPLLAAGWGLRRVLSAGKRWLGGAAVVLVLWLGCMVPMVPSGGEWRAAWDYWPQTSCTAPAVKEMREAGAKTPTTLFAPIPHRFDATYIGAALQSPGEINAGTGHRFWLGTDTAGHDIAAQMLFGTRISLTIGLVATGLSLLIGTLIGAVSGYFGGWTDMLLQRIVEIMMCFPTFILILIVVSMLGRDIFVIMSVIGLTSWAGTARLVRGEFLAQTVRDYVLAAESLGLPRWRIMFRHILPNALTPLLISATFGIAGAVGSESALSFLGLGDPNVPTWGSLLEQGRENIRYAWLIYTPGLAVFVLITALNLVGNGLREALDPKAA